MGKDDFVSGLKGMGSEARDLGENRVAIENYVIKSGRFNGRIVTVGIEIPPDFPVTPPTGPHITPCLLPINPNGATHTDRTAPSPSFGAEWQYLSRPFPNGSWPKTKRTVPVYMSFIRQLLETL